MNSLAELLAFGEVWAGEISLLFLCFISVSDEYCEEETCGVFALTIMKQKINTINSMILITNQAPDRNAAQGDSVGVTMGAIGKRRKI